MSITLACLLSDGAFHSGRELGLALGVGRAAVWKQVKALSMRGVTVDAVRGKGYRLVGGLDLLDSVRISSRLTPLATQYISALDILDYVESTNAVAMAELRQGCGKGYVCLAEQQSFGRGRRGRVWVSPYAKNIYASMTWTFDGGLPATQGLSIAVGVAVSEALESLGVPDVMLKWPNDVCSNGQKLAGVLIEVLGDLGGYCSVVIGVGINVAMPQDEGLAIGQPWTDMKSLGYVGERNLVAACLLSSLVRVLQKFEREGLSSVRTSWDRLDALVGRAVQIHVGGTPVDAVAIGIDSSGALVADTAEGRRAFSAGEVSVRVCQ